MASRLPLWYGQPRGAGLVSLSALEVEEDGMEEPGFFDQLWGRLFGWITDELALAAGVVLPFLALAIATGASAQAAPPAAVFLGLAAVLWLAVTGWASWLASSEGDDAPAWAVTVVNGLTEFGRGALIMFVVLTVIFVVLVVLAMIAAAMSDRGR